MSQTFHIKDEWIPVCLRCPLDECIRPEGYFSRTNYHSLTPQGRERVLGQCPVFQCEKKGYSPAQACNGKAAELGLREEVEWLEM